MPFILCVCVCEYVHTYIHSDNFSFSRPNVEKQDHGMAFSLRRPSSHFSHKEREGHTESMVCG